uniref:Glycosyltransferase 2-like domain-containing protein n=1 Tax=viral metagenome TaxID=1070528 RepID=A0A6C0LCQ6_9ZZZZ
MLKVGLTNNEQGSFLNLPSISDEILPTVTVVTPTYNRHDNFEIAIRNYKNFNYPRDKLYWIILDDSPNDSLKKQLPDDKSIRYIYSSKREPIGEKRNRLASECTTDIICHMDDDDYYYVDSVKIRVIAMLANKKAVSGCIEYNCYNLVDDSQFIARGKEELMNIGEASLCYLKDYWKEFKYLDTDTHEESVHFLQGNLSNYVDVPCLWILLSITHQNNVSGRRATAPVLAFSFLDALPAADFEYIKSLKMKLMTKDTLNAEAIDIVKKLKKSNNPEKIIDSLSIKLRKNIFIREYLNNNPTKRSCSEQDYLIICCSGQYIRELDFEKEKELVEFIISNKNKYRFTIYTNCEKGYSLEGITLSPYWKWRTGNKYNKCLVYADPSHLKLNINVNNIMFYNKYNFDVPEMNKAKVIGNFENQ